VPATVLADMGHCASLSHLGGVMKLLPLLRHGSGPSLSCHTALYEHPVREKEKKVNVLQTILLIITMYSQERSDFYYKTIWQY
jgi:hypothetical protein